MQVTTFLMFQGDAEAWLEQAVAAVPESEVLYLERYGPDGPGAEGKVAMAEALIGGLLVRCNDTQGHDFTFTPSFSLFVTAGSLDEHGRLHATLADGGQELMPADDYGFSQRFSWVQDRFGVSWQLNLP